MIYVHFPIIRAIYMYVCMYVYLSLPLLSICYQMHSNLRCLAYLSTCTEVELTDAHLTHTMYENNLIRVVCKLCDSSDNFECRLTVCHALSAEV